MSETARLHFLPWVRTGAAQAIAGEDKLSGSLTANPILRPWVRIAGHDAIGQTLTLRGPGHVTALGAQTVLKTEPKEGTSDFESNYFPFVELGAADLPWRFTPAAPGVNNQLRPWVVLVVVRQQEGVGLTTAPGNPLPVLRIEAPAKPSIELPDLSDSAAWVHVQTSLPPEQVADALENDPEAALARLVCPRRLSPNESWIACLVPAFDVGVSAALGEDAAMASQARPAWDVTSRKIDQEALRLPVFHHWTFSTGPDGDFELLARRLEADKGGTIIGRVDLDVTNPGPPLPGRQGRSRAVLADFVGALRSPGVDRAEVDDSWLETGLEELLERGAGRRTGVPEEAPAGYVPERDDPVVSPPLYGSFQADRYDVPDKRETSRQWMRTLNLRPEFRAIAGLGAAVVREGQESFMASAWAQAGEFREAQRAFDQARLASEIGRSTARGVARWDAGAALQATQRVQAWITSPASQKTLAVDLNRSAVPPGLVSAPFARATRPRTSLARPWSAKTAAHRQRRPPLLAVTETFMAATSPSADRRTRVALDFARTTLPVGAWTRDEALEAAATAALQSAAPPRQPAGGPVAPHVFALGLPIDLTGPKSGLPFDSTHAAAVRVENELRDVLTGRPVHQAPARLALDLSSAAASVVAHIDPLSHIQSGLVWRIPALEGLVAEDGALPSRLVLHPIFTDPLSRDLVRLDARYMLPGAERVENNRVSLLEADAPFVEAFLAGANHEMSRELIWREFPTSPRHTFFHRFWDTGTGGPDDIGEISRWLKPQLGSNLTGVASDARTVVLVRGDVVRRYPEAHVYLTRGVWRDRAVVPDPTHVSEPLLQGALDRRTVFYGFSVGSEDMRGRRTGTTHTQATAGWYITIEEPSRGPRFGLDHAADDGSDLTNGASDWRALSWGHLVPRGDTLEDVLYAVARAALPPRTPATMDRLTWGHNAAHMAAITWQVPFRLYIHADRLLPKLQR